MTGNQLRILERGLDVGGNFKEIRGARVRKPWWDMVIKRRKDAELRRVPSGSLISLNSGRQWEALRKFMQRDILKQINESRSQGEETEREGLRY